MESLASLIFLLAGLALQVDSPSSGSSFRTSGRSPTSGWSPLRTPGWFLLQDSLPFAIHLSSVGADLDENGPPVMNQIARGGYSLTPPEGGTTGVPLASGLRGQTPPFSSTLPGRFEPPDIRKSKLQMQVLTLEISTYHSLVVHDPDRQPSRPCVF